MQELRYIGCAQEIIFDPGSISRLIEALEPFGEKGGVPEHTISLKR
jgi:hypothetical protein